MNFGLNITNALKRKSDDTQFKENNKIKTNDFLKNSTTKQIIDSWINEYKSLFLAAVPVAPSNPENTKLPDCSIVPQPAEYLPVNSNGCPNSISSETCFIHYASRVSAPNQLSQPEVPKFSKSGYWGPLLRYGTYGVYRRYIGKVRLRKPETAIDDKVPLRQPVKTPFHLPDNIKIPRQAMLWTLQDKGRHKIQDLRQRQKDVTKVAGLSHINVLDQIAAQCGTCGLYLYSRLTELAAAEKQYFCGFGISKTTPYLSLDGAVRLALSPIEESWACELYMSDILLGQAFAHSKSRAKEACARQALRMLERQERLSTVGGLRFWLGTDFLVACCVPASSSKPAAALALPPFLTEPTEPLYKKDQHLQDTKLGPAAPKSMDDFWLYAPLLHDRTLAKTLDPVTLLLDSAEFSQMQLSFEMESGPDETFGCSVLIDGSEAARVVGLVSLGQARAVAALKLVDRLVVTQPLVVLQDDYRDDYQALLEGNGDASFLAESLSWNKAALDAPLPLESLLQHLRDRQLLDANSLVCSRSETGLELLLLAYGQSDLLTPFALPQSNLCAMEADNVFKVIRRCGLLGVARSGKPGLLVSKQCAHVLVKASLLMSPGHQFGVWRLLWSGKLSPSFLDNLEQYYSSTASMEEETSSVKEEHDLLEPFYNFLGGQDSGPPGLDF